MSDPDEESGFRLPLGVRWLLASLESRERLEFSQELAEMYRLRLRAGGRQGARAWLRREGRRAAFLALRLRLRPRARWPDRHASNRSDSANVPRRAREILMSLTQDARHAVRRLLRKPGFTSAVVLSLGVGLAGSGAIFSLLYSTVLAPLPYPSFERLATLRHSAPGADIDVMGTSLGTYVQYSESNTTLDGIALYWPTTRNVTADGLPERLEATAVAGDFFELLLAGAPETGRVLTADDALAGADPAVVISHGLWRRRFGGGADAVGSSIEINGTQMPIVGVLPEGFDFPTPDTDLWFSNRFDRHRVNLGGFSAEAIVRVAPGVTVDEAARELMALTPRLEERFPGRSFDVIVEQGRLTPHLTPLRDALIGDVAGTLWVLLASAGLLLLIGCANVANLVVVEAEGRRREVAMRRALGAGRAAVARHFLAESTILGLAAGIVGSALTVGAVVLVTRLGPGGIPRLHTVGVDLEVVAFVLGLSVATGFALGLIPLFGRQSNVARALREGTGRTTAGRSAYRIRDLITTTQIALTLVLLVGSGLMVRTFVELLDLDPGFDARDALTFELSLSQAEHPTHAEAARFHQGVIDRLSGIARVQAVGAVQCLPLGGIECSSVNTLTAEGMPIESGEAPPAVQIYGVTPGYFEAAGIPLLQGREMEPADNLDATGAALVSQSLARRLFSDGDALGSRIYPDAVSAGRDEDVPWYTVVGVVGDVPLELTGAPRETAYFALVPNEGSPALWSSWSLDYVVRTRGSALAVTDAVRAAVGELDPNLPVADVSTLEARLANARAPTTLVLVLLAIAASASLLLGVIGVYGMLSYVVSQRRGEIGIRMALGAGRATVRAMVLRHAAAVTAVGVAIGLAAAFMLTRFMRTLLYGVAAVDILTFGLTSTILVAAALVAAYLPARRASNQNPADVLSD